MKGGKNGGELVRLQTVAVMYCSSAVLHTVQYLTVRDIMRYSLLQRPGPLAHQAKSAKYPTYAGRALRAVRAAQQRTSGGLDCDVQASVGLYPYSGE